MSRVACDRKAKKTKRKCGNEPNRFGADADGCVTFRNLPHYDKKKCRKECGCDYWKQKKADQLHG